MRAVILIPARLSAARLPGKPLADIAGRPMIAHVWERAKASGAGDVAVATDSGEIARVVENLGGKAVLTREDHASGSDRIFEALGKLDAAGGYDTIINVQGDMPALDPALIPKSLEPLLNPAVDIATLAAPLAEDEIHDSAVVKAVVSEDGRALYFTRASLAYARHHIGLYAYRREALRRFVSLPPSPLEKAEKLEQLRALEAGMRIDVQLVNATPLGVDTPETLEKARRLLAGSAASG